MKRTLPLFIALALGIASCNSLNEFYGAATGSSLGGMFGSAIGGLIGGPRGSDAGTVVGMIAGGVAGATVANRDADNSSNYSSRSYSDDINYDYTPQRQYSSVTYQNLSVGNVTFSDENGDHCLGSHEKAYLVFEIYNEGRSEAYDIAPLIKCDNRNVVISPTAIISSLPAGRGARYKAALTTRGKLKNGVAHFTVSFDGGRTVVKTITIKTKR